MSPIDPELRAVPGPMVVEYGVQSGHASAWRCDDVGMELVPAAELRTPATRGLDVERLWSLLRGISAGAALPAVPVYRETDAMVVLNGMHRVAIARALGFTYIPCIAVSLEEARDFYRYPEGQQ